jgi:NAD(P)-dependent dehydrogenase (short-subunit alcohol dehydrogenase family)
MDLQLKRKRAIVTRSTAGIGFAIASGLAQEGAAVVINGRTDERVEKALGELLQAAPTAQVSGFVGDLATSEAALKLTSEHPDLDILVNNLGIYEPKAFPEIGDDDWERIWQTNVMSGVRLSRHYLPRMIAANWGRILFISSESAINIPTEMIHYGVTKTAQIALARGLAQMTVGTAVTVNSVLVGPTKSEGVTEFVEGMARQKGVDAQAVVREFFTHIRPSSLLKRFIEPEEIAHMVVYLSSPLAAATNGAAVRVEGGVIQSI